MSSVPTTRDSSPFDGLAPVREVVVPDLESMFRWTEHDYPDPLARWHMHPEVEIHLIRASTGLALVGDHVSMFGPGHVAIVGSGLPHDWISDLAPGEVVEGRDVVLQIHPEWLGQLVAVLPEAAEGLRLFDAAARGIEYTGATAESAAAHLEAIGRSTGTVRLQRLFGLLSTLSRAPLEEQRVLASRYAVPEADLGLQQRVDVVLRYINDHLDDDVRMSAAADLVGMSPSAFSRFFQQAAGRGFASVVRHLRVIRACRLLSETALPVVEVCYAAGYSNLSNFNRQFRAETGTTPRDYRRAAGAPRTKD
jgi:AraC-like DNA-binding protein